MVQNFKTKGVVCIVLLCVCLYIMSGCTTKSGESEVELTSASASSTVQENVNSEVSDKEEQSSENYESSSAESVVTVSDGLLFKDGGTIFIFKELDLPDKSTIQVPVFNVNEEFIEVNTSEGYVQSELNGCTLRIELITNLPDKAPEDVINAKIDAFILKYVNQGMKNFSMPEQIENESLMVRYITCTSEDSSTLVNSIVVLGMVSDDTASVVMLEGVAKEGSLEDTANTFATVCSSLGLISEENSNSVAP